MEAVSREAPDAVGSIQTRPSAISVWENISVRGNRSCRLCRRLAVVRGECGDVDQPGNTVIGSCGCDDGSAVRVADEDGRAADRPERAGYCGDIAFECVQAVLGGHHLVPSA